MGWDFYIHNGDGNACVLITSTSITLSASGINTSASAGYSCWHTVLKFRAEVGNLFLQKAGICYESTGRDIPEDQHGYLPRRENLVVQSPCWTFLTFSNPLLYTHKTALGLDFQAFFWNSLVLICCLCCYCTEIWSNLFFRIFLAYVMHHSAFSGHVRGNAFLSSALFTFISSLTSNIRVHKK